MSKSNGKIPLPPRFDHLVAQFVLCRDLADKMEADYKAEVAPVIRDREKIRGLLLEMLDDNGLELVRTDAGTVSVRVDSAASCTDPTVFMDFVVENREFDLLNRSPNKTAVKQYVDKHNTLPPGVKLDFTRKATVRKSS